MHFSLPKFVTSSALIAIFVGWGAPSANGQYINLDTPFQSNTESFYERIGIDFGFAIPGSQNTQGSRVVGLNPNGTFTQNGAIQFTQGSSGSAVPQFGGYDPASDATFGYANLNNGGGYQLGFRLGQGNTRTSTGTTPTITVPNGVPGSVNDSILRPFVTGVVPVVGGFPNQYFNAVHSPGPPISPLDIALTRLQQDLDAGIAQRDENGRIYYPGQEDSLTLSGSSNSYVEPKESTANTSDLSVAEIRRRRESDQESLSIQNQEEIDELIRLADGALENRKPGAARIFLRRAMRMADGELKLELLQRIESIQ